MELLLLGTGGADGWPNPWCDCASCSGMRARGEVRAQTAVLVDGVLLLDCGPEAPRQALRAGRSLGPVRHVLLTHAHPDHTAAMALVWRAWAGRTERLDLLGPPAALAACAPYLGPADPVDPRPVHAGDEVRVGGYTVRVLAAAHAGPEIGPAVLYDLTGPDGTRVLYATDTAPLPAATLAAVAGAAYDAVLLEATWGDAAGPDHHTLAEHADTVRALRRNGAVTDATRVLAIHLGHRNPLPPELDRRLAGHGAEALADLSVLRLPGGGGRVLVLGGTRSGKSAHAERLAGPGRAVTYVATAADRPDDPEWTRRLAAHRDRRPAGWRTVETDDIAGALALPGPLLLDSVTLWLAGALDADPADVAGRVDAVVRAFADRAGPVVAVSDEVGSGVVPASLAGRRFRDALGELNTRLAAAADEVWLVTAGLPRRIK